MSNKFRTSSSSTSSLIFLALFVKFLFALVVILIRLTNANPATIGLFRLLIAVSVLFIWNRYRDLSLSLNGRQKVILCFVGICFGFHWYFLFLSIKVGSPSTAALGVSTYGIQLAVLGALLGYDMLSRKDISALFLALIGLVLATYGTDSGLGNIRLGMVYALLSGTAFSFLPLLLQKIPKVQVETKAFYQFLFALFPFLLFSDEINIAPLVAFDWLIIFFLGFVCTGIAHTLWIQVASHVKTGAIGILAFADVPIVLLLSALVVGEQLTLRLVFGAFLVLFANVICMKARMEKGQIVIAAIDEPHV